jgi:hypothetical protein
MDEKALWIDTCYAYESPTDEFGGPLHFFVFPPLQKSGAKMIKQQLFHFYFRYVSSFDRPESKIDKPSIYLRSVQAPSSVWPLTVHGAYTHPLRSTTSQTSPTIRQPAIWSIYHKSYLLWLCPSTTNTAHGTKAINGSPPSVCCSTTCKYPPPPLLAISIIISTHSSLPPSWRCIVIE